MIALAGLERDVVIVACAISAGIHAALAPEHFAEGTGAGLGFAAAAVVLAALVIGLTRRPASATVVVGASAVLAGLLASYAFATTTGPPTPPPRPRAARRPRAGRQGNRGHRVLRGCAPALAQPPAHFRTPPTTERKLT